MNTYTIEDCIEMLAGYSPIASGFSLEQEDSTIVMSIARQVKRGTALTDRQQTLMQQKLSNYRSQFLEENIDLDSSLKNLRQPLRVIDRSKTVKLVFETEEKARKGYIVVKFPFKKLDAIDVNELMKHSDHKVYVTDSSEYRFQLTEQNVKLLLDFYTNKPSFEIDKELLAIYNKIQDMEKHRNSYVPRISNGALVNVHPKAKEIAEKELGPISEQNLIRYVDRKLRYGINEVDAIAPTTLSEKIAYRKGEVYSSKISAEPLDDLLSALIDLDRLPLLIMLKSGTEVNQLKEITSCLEGKIPASEQSVLFRTSGDRPLFNEMVRELKLNNWVDTNTKIVYVQDKLPKVLINSGWRPAAALENLGFILNGAMASFIKYHCDLIVYREEQESLFRKHSKLHALM